MLGNLCSLSPGFIRSGEYPQKNSSHPFPQVRCQASRTRWPRPRRPSYSCSSTRCWPCWRAWQRLPRLGQHRRRSHRAQGVLREACNASDLRPPNPHATLTRIYTIAHSSMTSLRLPTAPHMAHASSKPRQTPQRPATAPHEPQSALSRH